MYVCLYKTFIIFAIRTYSCFVVFTLAHAINGWSWFKGNNFIFFFGCAFGIMEKLIIFNVIFFN